MWPFAGCLLGKKKKKTRNAGAALERPPLQASSVNTSGLSAHGGREPPCTGIKTQPPPQTKKPRTHAKPEETASGSAGFPHASVLTVFTSVRVVITLVVSLLSVAVAAVVVRPCAVQCLVTGRPVWGCNNPAPTAHAPDSMLLKVHYK